VTDRVHAPMQAMEPSDRDTMCDRPIAEADLVQLTPRDHAVLPARDRRDLAVGQR
jgi:hypothetical protein